jgi:hypothetical protein
MELASRAMDLKGDSYGEEGEEGEGEIETMARGGARKEEEREESMSAVMKCIMVLLF